MALVDHDYFVDDHSSRVQLAISALAIVEYDTVSEPTPIVWCFDLVTAAAAQEAGVGIDFWLPATTTKNVIRNLMDFDIVAEGDALLRLNLFDELLVSNHANQSLVHASP